MPTTAYMNPESAFAGASNCENPSNILLSDNVRATLTHYDAIPASVYARWAKGSVPGGAVITSVLLEVEGSQAASRGANMYPNPNNLGNAGIAIALGALESGYAVGTINLSAAESAAILGAAGQRPTFYFITRASAANDGDIYYVDHIRAKFTYTNPAAPTVTSITPAKGPLTGATQVEIVGTGFYYDSTVTIDGVAATNIEVVSSVLIRCTTPAGTAGAKDVVVTNAGGSGTLTGGFTYLSVVDSTIKLYRGGAFVGDNKASAAEWDATLTDVEYGGASDLWGTTFTPAQVNASDFGVGISAVVGTNAVARVSHVELEVNYSIPGVADPKTYLAVLKVAADRNTAYPAIYQLPRSGFTIANDPTLDRKISNASLFTSRIYEPARYIEKTYRAVEFWADLDPNEGNTPGLQVWARIDDGTAFQLRSVTGAVATIRASGRQYLLFPPSDDARGKYFQLEFRVPALVGDQVAVALGIRNMVVRFNFRPETSEVHTMPLILGTLPVEHTGLNTERRSPYRKLLKLISLAGPGQAPVPMRDELGRNVYVHLTAVSYEEVTFKGAEEASLLAYISYRIVEYS